MWQLITAFLHCEYNYYCYECHYDCNTNTQWMDSFQVDGPLIGICMSQTLPPPSEGCAYARIHYITVACFSILLRLTFQQFLFKVYKCISAITTSNYSFH